MNKYTSLIILIAAFLIAGCSNQSGAMYFSERGIIKCLYVESIAFWSSGHTTYEIDGKTYETQSLLEFYPDSECENN